MEKIEYTTIDKSTWGEGPWQSEPDKVQWQDEATGLPCLIVRGPFGALCGYVGVAEGHPLYRMDYNDAVMDVHGGLTFSGMCQDTGGEEAHHSICHLPAPGEPDHVWWFGFDCSHLGDLAPLYQVMTGNRLRQVVYRDRAYVETECRSLAMQLAVADG